MKRFFIGFACAVVLAICVAATISQQGIFFRGVYGGEPLIGGDSPNQAVPWIDFRSNGVAIFQLPSTGIIGVANGGTGAGSLNSISWPTNTANFLTITNDLAPNAFTLLKGQRSTVTICLANNGSGCGIIYSNAATGKQHTYLMTPGAATETNIFTIRCNPSSMVAPTNVTVILNTTEIDYE